MPGGGFKGGGSLFGTFGAGCPFPVPFGGSFTGNPPLAPFGSGTGFAGGGVFVGTVFAGGAPPSPAGTGGGVFSLGAVTAAGNVVGGSSGIGPPSP